jgi:hypothetical protein
MNDQRAAALDRTGYERPRVERVLTPAELEQEIVYAGQDATADSE